MDTNVSSHQKPFFDRISGLSSQIGDPVAGG